MDDDSFFGMAETLTIEQLLAMRATLKANSYDTSKPIYTRIHPDNWAALVEAAGSEDEARRWLKLKGLDVVDLPEGAQVIG